MMPKPVTGSRAADWGVWRMSICLAVLASECKDIICIMDKKVSFSGFSADNMTVKGRPDVGGCSVLCAGDDAQYAPLILDAAKEKLGTNVHPREVAQAVDEAYHDQRINLIEKRVLRKFSLDAETFQKSGKRLLTETVYNRLCEKIDKLDLSLQFLICGFDSNGEGHIFSAGGDESVEAYDDIGLWAIGEGRTAALSCFAFHVTQRHIYPPGSDLYKTLTIALAAKFMAESANSVGKATFVVVLREGKSPLHITDSGVNCLRKQWLATDAPRLSEAMVRDVKAHIYPRRKFVRQSTSDMSVDQP